ncbi:hypothetical protein [Brevundimonas sp. DC300-4]|uniref:hypothetical protein n=1 Tax=Brevundimonas sp. DC300-4 TaxID=2804594 RepID=UPI003CEBF3DC
MDDELLELFQTDVDDGSLQKGFLFVSRSTYWTPWMVGGVQDRIEIGLFYEAYGQPRGPAFALEWSEFQQGVQVEIRSPVAAWRLLPMLDGLQPILNQIAASIDGDPLGADEVAKLLELAGFQEARRGLWR